VGFSLSISDNRPKPVHLWFRDNWRAGAFSIRQTRFDAYLMSLSLVAAATFLSSAVFNLVPGASLSLIYLVGIMVSAQLYGLWPAIFASVLSILAWDFFFTEPYFSLALQSDRDLFTLIFFMITALTMSSVTALVRQQNRQLAVLANKNQTLYDFAKELAAIGSVEEITAFTIKKISRLLGRETSVLLMDKASSGVLQVFCREGPSQETFSDRDLSAVLLLDELPRSLVDKNSTYLPLVALRGRVGALRIEGTSEAPLTESEMEPLSAMLSQVAVAVERIWLSEEHKMANLSAETERMRNALLLSVSHDLRTPLTTIIGSLSTMEMPDLECSRDSRLELVSMALTEAQRLDRFIANLLDMTRLELGDLKVTVSPVVVEDVIASAVQRMQALVPEFEALLQIPEELPSVMANFYFLEQAVFNLLDNATRYSAAPTGIGVLCKFDGSVVDIQVTDEGPGIPENVRKALFQKFIRAEQGDSGPSGTGLGLAIVKGFIDAMDGSVTARNRSDRQGAIFTIRLLAAQQDRVPAHALDTDIAAGH
jgi:two-component system sensor histidine kinase KdpD